MSQPSSPLVRVEGVAKSYPPRSAPAGAAPAVLRSVALTLGRGQTTSLVGASGSGKSTLLGLIAGLLQPDSGRILFDDQDLTRLDDTSRARLRGRRIGVVLQSGNLLPFLTAAENVELAVRLGGAGERPEATDLLARLGLADRRHALPRRLSGGENQRVALAVALANRPDLLLADEVTGELDAASADQVMSTIRSAASERGLTVLFVTHDRAIATQAHHQLRLVDGEVHPA